MRVGVGFDAHRFDDSASPLVLAGVIVAQQRGVAATSDGDVVAHAVTDAVLGAGGLGDMGDHFPSSDPQWEGADSIEMLRTAVSALSAIGLRPASADVTVVVQSIRIAPHRSGMRDRLASAMGLAVERVSVKATTTDGMGAIGSDEGLAAIAVVTLEG